MTATEGRTVREEPAAASTGVVLAAFAADALAVAVFAAVGRASHGEPIFAQAGLIQTAWPFAIGVCVGWFVARAWRAPLASVRTGVPLWISTVVIGMLLRTVTGQGTQVAFVVVAAVVLAGMLIGWRLLARLAARRR